MYHFLCNERVQSIDELSIWRHRKISKIVSKNIGLTPAPVAWWCHCKSIACMWDTCALVQGKIGMRKTCTCERLVCERKIGPIGGLVKENVHVHLPGCCWRWDQFCSHNAPPVSTFSTSPPLTSAAPLWWSSMLQEPNMLKGENAEHGA